MAPRALQQGKGRSWPGQPPEERGEPSLCAHLVLDAVDTVAGEEERKRLGVSRSSSQVFREGACERTAQAGPGARGMKSGHGGWLLAGGGSSWAEALSSEGFWTPPRAPAAPWLYRGQEAPGASLGRTVQWLDVPGQGSLPPGFNLSPNQQRWGPSPVLASLMHEGGWLTGLRVRSHGTAGVAGGHA